MSNLLIDAKVRAQLRRTDPFEVPGAYAWAKRVRASEHLKDVEEFRLVRDVASVAAHVRKESEDTLGRRMRRAGISEKSVRRMLESDRDDIADQLTRVIHLVGGEANIEDLVRVLIYWGPNMRRRVAIDYFGSTDSDDQAQDTSLGKGQE